MEDANVLYYTDDKRIQSHMSEILPDYIPKSMKELQQPGQDQLEIEQGSLHQDTMNSNFEVLVDRVHELLFSANVSSELTLLVRRTWFPNWKVYDNGNEITYDIDSDSGFLRLRVPTGKHLISIRFVESPIRAVSNIVTVVSFICLGVLLYARDTRS